MPTKELPTRPCLPGTARSSLPIRRCSIILWIAALSLFFRIDVAMGQSLDTESPWPYAGRAEYDCSPLDATTSFPSERVGMFLPSIPGMTWKPVAQAPGWAEATGTSQEVTARVRLHTAHPLTYGTLSNELRDWIELLRPGSTHNPLNVRWGATLRAPSKGWSSFRSLTITGEDGRPLPVLARIGESSMGQHLIVVETLPHSIWSDEEIGDWLIDQFRPLM